MDDLMNLLHVFYLNIRVFDENHFWIFDEEVRAHLLEKWQELSKKHNDPLPEFLSVLPPQQLHKITQWGIQRTHYEVVDLSKALKSFLKFIDKYPSCVYPSKVISSVKKRKHGWF